MKPKTKNNKNFIFASYEALSTTNRNQLSDKWGGKNQQQQPYKTCERIQRKVHKKCHLSEETTIDGVGTRRRIKQMASRQQRIRGKGARVNSLLGLCVSLCMELKSFLYLCICVFTGFFFQKSTVCSFIYQHSTLCLIFTYIALF